MAKEGSFVAGFKGGVGAIAALFFVFVVAPCALCGGLAVCGASIESFDTYQERAQEAAEETSSHSQKRGGEEETSESDLVGGEGPSTGK